MIYVTEVELDIERWDRKGFAALKDAERRFFGFYIACRDDKPIRATNGQLVYVIGCRLLEVDTGDVREAVRLVIDGGGTILRSDDDPYPEIVIDLDDL